MTNQLLQNQLITQKVTKRSWRSNLKRDIIKMLSGLMTRFYKMGSIDKDTKDHFYKSLRTYEKHIAIFGTIDNKLENFVPKVIIDSQLVVLGLLYPILLGVYLKQSILFILASVVISVIVIFIFFVTMTWLLKILAQDKSLLWLLLFSIASFLLINLTIQTLGLFYLSLLSATVYLLGYTTLFFGLIIYSSIGSYIRRLFVRRNPIAFLIDDYLEVLSLLNENAFDWKNKSKKQKILENLKDISNIISRCLPNYIQVRDNLVSPWYLDRLDRMVSSVRLIETEILTPNEKTDSELITKLTVQLMAFLSGYWGEFEIQEMVKITRPQRLLYMWNLIKKFISAVFPISAILLFQQTQYALPANSVSYFIGITLLWAIIRLINLLDPSALEDISKLKDVYSLLSKK